MDCKIYVKGNGSRCVLEGYIKDINLGQGACLKGMSRTITTQSFTLVAITDAEKAKLGSNFDIKINEVSGP